MARQEAGRRVPADLGKVEAKIGQVFQERWQAALQRHMDATVAAGCAWSEVVARIPDPAEAWRDMSAYWQDFAQRTLLFWDTLRQRGNNWIDHEKAGKPPLLHFPWKPIADGRTFDRPVNYALVQIEPPEGTVTDPDQRPFVIIDPRAGHGPGIGGFKQDSEVGVALAAGHPVYFVIFYPVPVPGQTLADVSRAEAEFLRIVRERHPKARKPVLVGNCQGGWAAMLVGAVDPDLPGPIVINGAPMSYWAGNDGENPMRYAGGMLGGVWPALLASDLGAGLFDGAYLVDNFEYLNPANTFFDKYYTLFSKIDTEPQRFLEFERWWGGFFLLGRDEIKWIVENLFVGNKLASGQVEWSEGRALDLRRIRSPIVLFASLGDNITPPQQAFNWVADLYPTTEDLKANGQVIVGLIHKSVGHLGIFVSGQVARREHAQIVDLIGYIEHLPPGLYGMQIEEREESGKILYDVVLTERRVEDLQVLQKFGRRDEIPFQVVKAASDVSAMAYETFLHPWIAAAATPAGASVRRALHPQRLQRWAVSDINPFLSSLGRWADLARASRAPRDESGLSAATERWCAAVTSASWDLFRDLRDASVEHMFYQTYAVPALLGAGAGQAEAEGAGLPAREAAPIRNALSRIEEGGRTKALVRMALLLQKAGPRPRRLSSMKQVRELVGKDVGLLDMPADLAREVIREQSYIVNYEPEQALATLPKLLRTPEDRDFTLRIVNRLSDAIEIDPSQRGMVAAFRNLLGDGSAIEAVGQGRKAVMAHRQQGSYRGAARKRISR
ncbi:DUF3141 domain-containing protein [Microvirga thermotolerans]|uniref:DUF3141 domain-containing protein n=1 Tax=Microvirga thermotolerans TaxID=2651334 RepID=A0A5P9JTJ3_9HYPH|nr:DUF3141 domain-containing protein [Microvirga thermotolerans]QFU14790.1 DUF3141 domain-containing protein [Microvirga thermotolerans]